MEELQDQATSLKKAIRELANEETVGDDTQEESQHKRVKAEVTRQVDDERKSPTDELQVQDSGRGHTQFLFCSVVALFAAAYLQWITSGMAVMIAIM